MKETSFGFVELAEKFFKDVLSSPPLGGGSWGFERSVNFSDRSCSLKVLLKNLSGVSKTKISIQARQTGSAKEYSIQGWSEVPDEDTRTGFVLKESNPYRLEEEVFEIVDRLLTEIPERDQSVAIERPVAPPPKSTFEPLIPQIQSLPEKPEPAPANESPTADSFDSTQAFIDSLLSGGDAEKAPAPEEPPSTPEAKAPVEEQPPAEEPAAEEPSVKPKAAKAKKSAKS